MIQQIVVLKMFIFGWRMLQFHINRDLKTQYVPNWYDSVIVAKSKILRVLFVLNIFLTYDPSVM